MLLFLRQNATQLRGTLRIVLLIGANNWIDDNIVVFQIYLWAHFFKLQMAHKLSFVPSQFHCHLHFHVKSLSQVSTISGYY